MKSLAKSQPCQSDGYRNGRLLLLELACYSGILLATPFIGFGLSFVVGASLLAGCCKVQYRRTQQSGENLGYAAAYESVSEYYADMRKLRTSAKVQSATVAPSPKPYRTVPARSLTAVKA